jgi:hypothetical protein
MPPSDRIKLFDEEELKGYLKENGFPVGRNVDVEETGVYNTGPNKGRQFGSIRVTGVPGAIEYTVRVFLGEITHGWQGLGPLERMMKGYE